jgi:c(7)-type cytochrome triheme protein
MRARVVVGIGALALAAAVSAWVGADDAPAEPDVDAYGFDHLLHEGKVAVSGAQDLACTACHSVNAAGTIKAHPNHAACYGACHGTAPAKRVIPRAGKAKPYPVADDERRLCENCHSPTALDRVVAGTRERLAASYPPYRVDPDYGLVMSHPKHVAATADAKSCQNCHEVPADGAVRTATPAKPHARCVSCHASPTDATIPAMDQCTTCHLGAYGPAAAPHLSLGAYTTSAAFSHDSHAARPGGDACIACHQTIATTEGTVLPTPTKAECGSCHDGDKAFSMTDSRCTECHSRAPELPRQRPKPGDAFSHTVHAGLTEATCATCHSLDATGAPLPPSSDHAPCSNGGCHLEEFAATKTTICTACHVGDEPWRALHFDRPPGSTTEFGARFPHRTHLAGATPLIADPCSHCHQVASGDRELGLPRDHTTCSGAGCHDPAGASRVLRDNCDGCHVTDLMRTWTATRLSAEWTVRAKFRHAPHTDACVTCHDSVIDSTSLSDIRPPRKQTCAECHDGSQAFKLTGHSCARCHGT